MYNIIIKNGTVVDGTGAPQFRADVGVKDDKIDAIGDLSNEEAEFQIDAEGKIVTPGFIDINNHSDSYWRLFLNPDLESLVYQGITTIIGGNCGSSLAPLANPDIIRSVQKWVDISRFNINWLSVKEFFAEMEKRQISVNFGMLVGHGTIRRGIIGDEVRNLTHNELEIAKRMLGKALDEGALGMSTGLIYTHAKLANHEELEALAQEVGKRAKIYATHVRGESSELSGAIEEAVNLVNRIPVKIQISHLKAMGRKNWRLIDRALSEIEGTSRKGIDINFDVYPYASTGSVLYTLLPDWVAEGGKKAMVARLKDKVIREKVIAEMKENKEYDYSLITIASSPLNGALVKRKISDIARSQGKEVEEVIVDILIASEGRVITNMKVLSENTVKKLIKHPLSIVSSNGSGYNLAHSKTSELVHPRCFGTFPKLIGKYVRDSKALSLEEAIRKITALPAEKYNLKKRGKIERGCKADIAVFDLERIEASADEENPYQYSKGIEWLITNGRITIKNGKYTGLKSGELIKG